MYIIKINEFFDNEDLKSRFEIPYLKGEMGNEIGKWDKLASQSEENSESFYRKLIFRYPIFSYFHKDVKELSNGVEIYCLYATSKEPIDGNSYYAQLVFSFNPEDKKYYVAIVMRNINDYNNQQKWNRNELIIDNVDKVYQLTSSFLDSCIKLNIIDPNHKSALHSN